MKPHVVLRRAWWRSDGTVTAVSHRVGREAYRRGQRSESMPAQGYSTGDALRRLGQIEANGCRFCGALGVPCASWCSAAAWRVRG